MRLCDCNGLMESCLSVLQLWTIYLGTGLHSATLQAIHVCAVTACPHVRTWQPSLAQHHANDRPSCSNQVQTSANQPQPQLQPLLDGRRCMYHSSVWILVSCLISCRLPPCKTCTLKPPCPSGRSSKTSALLQNPSQVISHGTNASGVPPGVKAGLRFP